MPLNMNTIGMGNSSGNSGSGRGSGSCIYSNNEFSEQIILPSSPEFTLHDDCLKGNEELYWNNNQVSVSYYNHQLIPEFMFYANHDLFIMIEHSYNSSNYVDSGSTDNGIISYEEYQTDQSGIYKFSSSGLTRISLPVESSECYIKFNRNAISQDHIDLLFMQQENGNLGDGDSYYAKLYRFNGTSFTLLYDIRNVFKEMQDILNIHYSYENGYVYGFYYYKNNLFIEIYYKNIYLIQLDENYHILEIIKDPGNIFYSDNDASRWIGNHNTYVVGNNLYYLYRQSAGNNDGSTSFNKYMGIEKYTITENPNSYTLTRIDYLIYKDDTGDSYDISTAPFIYPISSNHALTGILYTDGKLYGRNEGITLPNNGSYQYFYLYDHAFDITLNNYSGLVEEKNIAVSDILNKLQKILVLESDYPSSGYSGYDIGIWTILPAFDIDISSRKFKWALCLDDGNIFLQVERDSYTYFTVISESGKCSEYLSGYFETGDTIYVNGKILSITDGDSTTEINQTKYTLNKTGIFKIKLESENENIPIIVVQDIYGSYQKLDIVKNGDTTIVGSALKNTKINGIKINETTHDLNITDDSFSKRINVDMSEV